MQSTPSSLLRTGWKGRGLITAARRVFGAAAVGFVIAAALSGDFDVANRGASNECATTSDFCLPVGYIAGGFVVAAIMMAAILPVGFWLARLERGYLIAGFLLPIATEQLSGVNLVGTVHPLWRYLAATAIAFGLLGLVAHALESRPELPDELRG